MTSRLIRSQGVLVTDDEIRQLVEFVSAQGTPAFDPSIQNQLESSAPAEEVTEEDEMLVEKSHDSALRAGLRQGDKILAFDGFAFADGTMNTTPETSRIARISCALAVNAPGARPRASP